MDNDEALREFPINPEGWKDDSLEPRHDSISIESDGVGVKPEGLELWASGGSAERDSHKGTAKPAGREVSSLEEMYREGLELRFGPWSEELPAGLEHDDETDPDEWFEAASTEDPARSER